MKIKNKAFTLVELLVVVLIIGILAAIAVPQYQKAVAKALLHQGVSLVESLYQAQQAYALAHGDFATDIDALDLSLPINESCEKADSAHSSGYTCDFGIVNLGVRKKAIVFVSQNLAYLHFYKEDVISSLNVTFEADKRYCWASPEDKNAQSVCENMGGTLVGENPGVYKYYELK